MSEHSEFPAERDVRSTLELAPEAVMPLLGQSDENLRALEQMLTADIHVRGNAVTLTGKVADVALAERVISELAALAKRAQPLTPDAVRRSIAMLTEASPIRRPRC